MHRSKTASYSITSSAHSSRPIGTSIPSAFAEVDLGLEPARCSAEAAAPNAFHALSELVDRYAHALRSLQWQRRASDAGLPASPQLMEGQRGKRVRAPA
jgi:hypothetical protein